jgi:hypothetical protein
MPAVLTKKMAMVDRYFANLLWQSLLYLHEKKDPNQPKKRPKRAKMG